MSRTIRQLRQLQRKHKRSVILCAGDLFDRWNAPPEVINWALENLPRMYAIPGNHDLPEHREDLEHRSAYGTLARSNGLITDLSTAKTPMALANGLVLYAAPFDGEIPEREHYPSDGLGITLHVLLIHRYLWVPGRGYHQAPKEARLGKVAKTLSEFDVVVVGDNHVAFDRTLKSGTRVINCGTLMRRRSDEASYEPRVGLIHESGNTTTHQLSIKNEILTALEDVPEDEGFTGFVDKLAELEASGLSFREALVIALKDKKVSKLVREIGQEVLDSDG